MITYFFFLIFSWILVILSIKLLKDFALTSIFGLLMIFLGVYAFSSGLSADTLIYVFGLAHIFIGFYFVFRSSIDLITNKWKKPQWREITEWSKKKNLKKNQ